MKHFIEDQRVDFKGVTYNGYKLSNVLKQLIQTLEKAQLEPSCYWVAELTCSGHFVEIWETFIFFYSRCIHGGNPDLAPWLAKQLVGFKTKMKIEGHVTPPLNYRNCPDMRRLYMIITSRLVNSHRVCNFDDVKISKPEFEFSYMTTMLSDNIPPSFAVEMALQNFSYYGGLEIPLKELFWQVREKNMVRAKYWLFWILDFAIVTEKKLNDQNDEEAYNDIVWTIWKYLLTGLKEEQVVEKKRIHALFELFKFHLSSKGKNKSKWTRVTALQWRQRKYVLLFAIHIFANVVGIYTNHCQMDNMPELEIMLDSIYRQIKIQKRSK